MKHNPSYHAIDSIDKPKDNREYKRDNFPENPSNHFLSGSPPPCRMRFF